MGVWRLSCATESFACLKPTKTYLKPPPGYRFRRPWYFRPWFYIPVAILAVMALFVTVFFSSVVVDLQAQANSFDLTKLDQMESASVILDRNGKIFGQIYVENRETVPYEKLAPRSDQRRDRSRGRKILSSITATICSASFAQRSKI